MVVSAQSSLDSDIKPRFGAMRRTSAFVTSQPAKAERYVRPGYQRNSIGGEMSRQRRGQLATYDAKYQSKFAILPDLFKTGQTNQSSMQQTLFAGHNSPSPNNSAFLNLQDQRATGSKDLHSTQVDSFGGDEIRDLRDQDAKGFARTGKLHHLGRDLADPDESRLREIKRKSLMSSKNTLASDVLGSKTGIGQHMRLGT